MADVPHTVWDAVGGIVIALLGGGVLGALFKTVFSYFNQRHARELKAKQDREAREAAAQEAEANRDLAITQTRDDTIREITLKVQRAAEEERERAEEERRRAEALVARYEKLQEDTITALNKRIDANEQHIELLKNEIKICEKRCEECDVARHQLEAKVAEQDRQISELRLLVVKTEGGKGTAFVTCNEDGVIEEWNEMATILFKMTRDEAMGSNIDRLIPTKYRELHHASLDMANQTGKLKDLGWRDFFAVDIMGNEFPVSVRLSMARVGQKKKYTAELRERELPVAEKAV